MPLHDWSKTDGWEGVHLLWMTAIARALKPKLPSGYRAYLGTLPALTIDAPSLKPDVAVRGHHRAYEHAEDVPAAERGGAREPDVEVAVTTTLEPTPSVFVEQDGRLVAAIELLSPRNKDRPSSREGATARYAGYLINGVNLLVVDVHPRPAGFSVAAAIERELEVPDARPLPAPLAAAYRVGEGAAGGGRYLAIWREPLAAGEPLPDMPVPLTVHRAVTLDLESTYMSAAADAYLA